MSWAKCATCGEMFGSVTGFDRHRRSGKCLPPAEAGMELKGRFWRLGQDTEALERLTGRSGDPS